MPTPRSTSKILAPENSVQPPDRGAWRDWLSTNHTRNEGIWLISLKKSSGLPRLEYDDAVEEAICFGWIDSKSNALDDERSMRWYAPRKAGTGWSKLNKQRVEKLLASGLIEAPGMAKIEAARRNGSWAALDKVEALELPPDLLKAFRAQIAARKNFEAFPRSAKRAILEWISLARRPETRMARINETVTSAANNVRANQWTKK